MGRCKINSASSWLKFIREIYFSISASEIRQMGESAVNLNKRKKDYHLLLPFRIKKER
jgi:hypothetical protein